MAQTLTKLDQVPDWVMSLYAEIDRLEFNSDRFMPDMKLSFGTAEVEGAEAVKNFFIAMDGPLSTHHRAHDFWDGGNIKMVLGDAVIAQKATPEKTVTPPFFHRFTMSEEHPEKVAHLLIIVGPINPGQGHL